MRIGMAMAIGARRRQLAASIKSLFAAGEQGVWYDPSDLSTLFQDAAGTTPVTAVEQPVGLMLDKSKGLVLGPELVTNGTFDANVSGWTANTGFATITWEAGAARFIGTFAEFAAMRSSAFSTVVGKTYVATAQVLENTGAQWRMVATTSGGTSVALGSSYTGAGLASLVFTATTASTIIEVRNGTGATTNRLIDNISVRELPGNHATQTTSTSRPVLKQDAGGQYYLKFDGVDDGMVTNSIDFTATDKMTVFAGVRKLSDAAPGMVAETSSNINSNNGAFYYATSETGSRNQFASKGTIIGNPRGASVAAPRTFVGTGVANIASDYAGIMENSGAYSVSSNDQGTGNYGNYPLYIGRRGGTTLPFNGHLYSLIVRGAATTDTRIAQTERWVNKKTGAY